MLQSLSANTFLQTPDTNNSIDNSIDDSIDNSIDVAEPWAGFHPVCSASSDTKQVQPSEETWEDSK